MTQRTHSPLALQVKLSTKSFGTEAAAVAAKAIENVSGTLTHADISDIIAGRPEKEVLGALQIISKSLAKAKLKFLDLSDNALGQKGILACAAAFEHQVCLFSIALLDTPACTIRHTCLHCNTYLLALSDTPAYTIRCTQYDYCPFRPGTLAPGVKAGVLNTVQTCVMWHPGIL